MLLTALLFLMTIENHILLQVPDFVWCNRAEDAGACIA